MNATILALERIDVSTTPELEPIDYRDLGDLDKSIERIADAINSRRFYEAMMRIQTAIALHLSAIALHVPSTHFLNLLMFIHELKLHTGEQYITLQSQPAILNSLTRADQDRALRKKLNILIPLFNDGDVARGEAEIWQCLDHYLPELAASSSKDLRAAVLNMARQFQNHELSDILLKVDSVVKGH